MSATAVAIHGSARDQWTNVRLIPAIETYPGVVRFAQTTLGKATLWALFVVGLQDFLRAPLEWAPIAAGLLATTLLPAWRWTIVAVCTVGTSAIQTRSLTFLIVIAFGALLFWHVRRWPRSQFSQRPVAYLFVGYALMVVISSAVPKDSSAFHSIWKAVGLAIPYMWFMGYALKDRAATFPKDLSLEVGSFSPFWGSTATPFPKGAAYLRRIEARDPEQLAVTQLKGIKLLVWAILLALFLNLWIFFFHSYLRVPWAAQALARSVQGAPYPWYICWASQVLSFVELLLQITVFGHRIVACCRFAGFNALRNTYRPLSSTTVSEFFNRFYYYFKELLVDFFFYPTFFRYFKKQPRLRLVAATFAAAGLGNMFYHFMRDYWMIPQFGLLNAILNLQVFAFYCLALATGLSISQLRKRSPRSGLVRGRILPGLSVLLFYCVLDVFGSSQRNYPLVEHLRFLGHMFGIDL
jgi:hypothetical protein